MVVDSLEGCLVRPHAGDSKHVRLDVQEELGGRLWLHVQYPGGPQGEEGRRVQCPGGPQGEEGRQPQCPGDPQGEGGHMHLSGHQGTDRWALLPQGGTQWTHQDLPKGNQGEW